MEKLKVQITPAFLQECEIEISGDQLIVMLSALQAQGKKCTAYHAVLDSTDEIIHLIEDLREIIRNPTPPQMITIADGICIRATYRLPGQEENYTFTDLEEGMPELDFFQSLFALCAGKVGDPVLSNYFHEINEKYLG